MFFNEILGIRVVISIKVIVLNILLVLTIQTDAVAFSGAHFSTGTGTIYLDDVACTGSETNLTNCPRSSSVYCRYGHSEDAGVRCQGLTKCCSE